MTNNIKNNIRSYHSSNYGCKYSNSSLNSNNLSLIANVSSSVAQVKCSVKEYASLSILFSDVTPVITHLFDFSDSEKQGFTSHKYSTDTIGANIYDGLSGPNKIPLVGNKPRRLNTVVNNLSPSFFAGGNKLTNCSGAIYHG